MREAGRILREMNHPGFEYRGFIEGDDLGKGTVDVAVTEGFAGNIALKTAEGTARQIGEYLRSAMARTWAARLGYLFAQSAFRLLREKMDPRKVNGGVFLGLNGVVIKSHGGTDAEGFASAIDLAREMATQRPRPHDRRGQRARRGAQRRRIGRAGGLRMIRSVVRGIGSYLPAKVLTNADLAAMVDTSDEWIVQRTGIRERHIAAEGELTSDLATAAARKALESAGLSAADIDLIVLATSTPDNTFPASAVTVQNNLGIHSRRGVRPAGGLLRLRLCARHRRRAC